MSAFLQIAAFTMAQVLSYPFPMSLVSAPHANAIAYSVDQKGLRSIWIARAPDYTPRELAHTSSDDGTDYNSLRISRDGGYAVYVQGGSADPSADPQQPQAQVYSVATTGGTPKLLGDGRAPAISPDGTRVAFVNKGAVWIAPIDASAPAKRLFYDLGSDWDLQWSPKGDAIAFVSSRRDHSFIGVYRNARTPLQFLAPSVTNDMEPRWSPDGTRIAFARTPGDGGPLPSPLDPLVVPWSIWVARVDDGSAKLLWQSPHTPRASFPTEGGDVDLSWSGNDRVVFVCEMDNWPHLYAVSAAGGTATLLTPGSYAVEGPVVSPDGRYIYYGANTGATPGDIDRSHLFRVDTATKKIDALTSGAGSQWWPAPLASGALAYAGATAQQPPLVMLAKTAAAPAQPIDAALLPRDFPERDLVTPKDVAFRAPGGTLVHGQLFAQPGAARRPGVVFVHGGPMRQMLLTWNAMDYYSNAYAVDQYLVNRGFAVLSVNYRSGVNYGHDFHYALRTGWTGASEYQDVLAGARFLQHQANVDSARIGIWGGSWGGYLTALALARNSGVFKAGVDFSGVHDLVHDAVGYFRDSTHADLADLKPWYRLAWNSSPVADVAKWRSPVLVIQGDDDPDVSFHQMVDLIPRLERYHVPFEHIVLPDEVHGFLRYASWLRTDEATAEFLERHLLHGPRSVLYERSILGLAGSHATAARRAGRAAVRRFARETAR
jgi:dipeptidyl aminopeptidase/acylaminoacyl peptidase